MINLSKTAKKRKKWKEDYPISSIPCATESLFSKKDNPACFITCTKKKKQTSRKQSKNPDIEILENRCSTFSNVPLENSCSELIVPDIAVDSAHNCNWEISAPDIIVSDSDDSDLCIITPEQSGSSQNLVRKASEKRSFRITAAVPIELSVPRKAATPARTKLSSAANQIKHRQLFNAPKAAKRPKLSFYSIQIPNGDGEPFVPEKSTVLQLNFPDQQVNVTNNQR